MEEQCERLPMVAWADGARQSIEVFLAKVEENIKSVNDHFNKCN